jgi:hypothetical protein
LSLILTVHFSGNATASGMHLAFGESQILETTNYVTYTAENFVSDIGGLAGLFLGFSLLSLFELIVKAYEAIKNFIEKSKNHKVDNTSKKVAFDPNVVIIDLLFDGQTEAER